MIAAMARTAARVEPSARASDGGASEIGSSQMGRTTRPLLPPARMATTARKHPTAAARRSMASALSSDKGRGNRPELVGYRAPLRRRELLHDCVEAEKRDLRRGATSLAAVSRREAHEPRLILAGPGGAGSLRGFGAPGGRAARRTTERALRRRGRGCRRGCGRAIATRVPTRAASLARIRASRRETGQQGKGTKSRKKPPHVRSSL